LIGVIVLTCLTTNTVFNPNSWRYVLRCLSLPSDHLQAITYAPSSRRRLGSVQIPYLMMWFFTPNCWV